MTLESVNATSCASIGERQIAAMAMPEREILRSTIDRTEVLWRSSFKRRCFELNGR